MVKSKLELWNEFLEQVRTESAKATFQANWVSTQLLELNTEDKTAVISAPNERVRSILDARLRWQAERTLRGIMGADYSISFVTTGEPSANPFPNPLTQAKSQAKTEDKPVDEIETVEIRGEPSNEYAKPAAAWIPIPHYAIRFLRPFVGRTAFDLWEAVWSYKVGIEQGWNSHPKLATLMRAIDMQNRAHFMDICDHLQENEMIEISTQAKPGKAKYIFTPLPAFTLSFPQHLTLDKRLQKEHMDWLEMYNRRRTFNMRAWLSVAPREEWQLAKKKW
jgi:hypothetical protein